MNVSLFVKKIMLCTLVSLAFLFMQAKIRRDSSENKSIEKNTKISTVFIAKGTFIYGVEKIRNGEVKIALKKISRNTSKTHRKNSLKKTQRENPYKKENAKDAFEYKIKIANKDTQKKFQIWLSEKLKGIADSQYKSNFTTVKNQINFKLFFEKAGLIKTFEICKNIFFKNRPSCIRPPPRLFKNAKFS